MPIGRVSVVATALLAAITLTGCGGGGDDSAYAVRTTPPELTTKTTCREWDAATEAARTEALAPGYRDYEGAINAFIVIKRREFRAWTPNAPAVPDAIPVDEARAVVLNACSVVDSNEELLLAISYREYDTEEALREAAPAATTDAEAREPDLPDGSRAGPLCADWHSFSTTAQREFVEGAAEGLTAADPALASVTGDDLIGLFAEQCIPGADALSLVSIAIDAYHSGELR